MLVIEIKIKNKEIRIISGYRPQESWSEPERMPFFVSLEKEIARAELMGKSIIIEMDSNSKLGPDYIFGYPHKQSPNGIILAGILDCMAWLLQMGLKTNVLELSQGRGSLWMLLKRVLLIIFS